MKASDYLTVISIVIVGTIISYFLVNSLLGDPKEKEVSFEYLESVELGLVSPDAEMFNAGAINPTVEVYVGSCVDTNQDGVIDSAELIECGEAAPETDTGETQSGEGGLSKEENEAINRAEGYAAGTTEEQRAAVQNQINEYAEQQKNTEEVADEAARRETTSTGN